jgi:hypothetical protein
MAAYKGGRMTDTLKRVSAKHKCVLCQHPDWCGYSADGVWAVCMRVKSDRPTANGGWLHRLKDAPPAPFRPALRPPPPRPSLLDMSKYHAALRRLWKPEDVAAWAERLNVWEYALEALQPAWDAAHEALAFPMRDGDGVVTGIRLRNAEGKKWAVTGGKDGLFYAPELAGPDLVICEGPTDTAAALSLDLPAVGRPSCLGAVAELKALCLRLRVKSLTIVADHDTPHLRGPPS